MSPKYILTCVVLLSAATVGGRAATTTISQVGQQFSEKTVSAAIADTLVFQNDDTVRHNIRIINESDEISDLGVQQPGEQLIYKLDKSGKFRARCGIHPSMKLAINVK